MILSSLLGLAVLGCGTALEPALSDWQDGYEAGDSGFIADTSAAREFGVITPLDLGYDVRLQTSNTTEDCILSVPDDFTSYTGIECTYDIPELDLYGSGLTFELFVPPDSCEYLIYQFYMYEAWESGYGPTDVSYTIDKDGNIIDGENSFDGEAVCEYNYLAQNPTHPNCCQGTYTETVTDLSGDEKVVTVRDRSWGGLLSDCYDGAAFADPNFIEGPDGFPMATIVPLYGAGYTQRFEWGSVADRYSTNVVLANHYDPADHDGTMPAGLTGEFAQPYYTFRCYDSGEELLAKIDMVVREWNEATEFDSDGDPETSGVEVVSGTPIDDRDDWATATPGSDTYIRYND